MKKFLRPPKTRPSGVAGLLPESTGKLVVFEKEVKKNLPKLTQTPMTITTQKMELLSGFEQGQTVAPLVLMAQEKAAYSIPGSYASLAIGLPRVKTTPTQKLFNKEMKANYGFKSTTSISPLKSFEKIGTIPKQKIRNILGTKQDSRLLMSEKIKTGTSTKQSQMTKNLVGYSFKDAMASKTATASKVSQAEKTSLISRTNLATKTSVAMAQKMAFATRTRILTRTQSKQFVSMKIETM